MEVKVYNMGSTSQVLPLLTEAGAEAYMEIASGKHVIVEQEEILLNESEMQQAQLVLVFFTAQVGAAIPEPRTEVKEVVNSDTGFSTASFTGVSPAKPAQRTQVEAAKVVQELKVEPITQSETISDKVEKTSDTFKREESK